MCFLEDSSPDSLARNLRLQLGVVDLPNPLFRLRSVGSSWANRQRRLLQTKSFAQECCVTVGSVCFVRSCWRVVVVVSALCVPSGGERAICVNLPFHKPSKRKKLHKRKEVPKEHMECCFLLLLLHALLGLNCACHDFVLPSSSHHKISSRESRARHVVVSH